MAAFEEITTANTQTVSGSYKRLQEEIQALYTAGKTEIKVVKIKAAQWLIHFV